MERDIIEDLKELASADWHTRIDTVDVLNRAIAEIERLRRIAGAVTDGETLADIKLRSI